MFHQAMEGAEKKFVGEHDFRNFCKMDALNVHNYRQHVTSFKVSPSDMRLALVKLSLEPILFLAFIL